MATLHAFAIPLFRVAHIPFSFRVIVISRAFIVLLCSVRASNSTRKAAFEHISKYIFMRHFPHEFIILASVQQFMLRGGYNKNSRPPRRVLESRCALLVGEKANFLRATIHILASNLIYYSCADSTARRRLFILCVRRFGLRK
jgi:hypothetical protein